MMFDRLYQAWVVSYSDGSLPMTDPLARPWELSCRGCLDEGECACVLILCCMNRTEHVLKCFLPDCPHDCTSYSRCSTHSYITATAGNDDEMMLCDHCDANHHIYCLRPPLSKVRERLSLNFVLISS